MLRLLSTFVRNMIVLPPKNVSFDFQDSGARRNSWFGFLSAFWTREENIFLHLMHTGANKERNSNWTESTTRDTLLSRAASPPDAQTGWRVSRVMTIA